MRSDPALALSLTLLIALFYLVLLRLIDPYEKEPLWALGLMLFLGAASAGAAAALLTPEVREGSALAVALTAELSKTLAIALGVAVFGLVRRRKGWSELNGTTDGIVYGAAAGLGFATGGAFVSEIAFSASGAQLPEQPGFLEVAWTTALSGLSEGIFGGMIGAGVVAACESQSRLRAVLFAVAGLVAAVLTHWVYAALADPGSPFDSGHLVGDWLALGLAILLLLAVLLHSVAAERRAAAEMEKSEGSLQVRARRGTYLRTFAEGAIEEWLKLRALHSRQVQLAITQRRLRATPESDPARREALKKEIGKLKASVATIESEGPAADRGRWLPGGRARVTAWVACGLLLACGSALIAMGAVSERDAQADAAELRTEALSSARSGPLDDGGPSTPEQQLLRDAVVHRAGPHLLMQARENREAFAGAREAYDLSYATRRGARVSHQVARFASRGAAERSAGRMIRRLRTEGWKPGWMFYRGANPAVLERGDREAIIWWSGRTQASVTTGDGTGWDFSGRLSY